MAPKKSVQRPQAKRKTSQSRVKTPRSGGKKRGGGKKSQNSLPQKFFLIAGEIVGLAAFGLAVTILLLGHFGNRLAGTNLVHNLLPFAGAVLGLIVAASLFLSGWKRLRIWLRNRSVLSPTVISLLLPLLFCAVVPHHLFTSAFVYYRTLIGGKEEAGRMVIAHQVYATYRRLDTAPLETMILRAEPFARTIEEAAEVYGLDGDLLKGLAAVESSFLPRKSGDGGEGLFQITKVPKEVAREVAQRFPEKKRQPNNPRYNAFLGAATLKHYLAEMNNDLFLGLLAYNIGPANGGLRFIMQQYGVTDFTTIQPYLLQLPRDYPIRVLAYALSFRINRKEGRLLPYEQEDNALTIQRIGIPGQIEANYSSPW
jgi:hypothetical protein